MREIDKLFFQFFHTFLLKKTFSDLIYFWWRVSSYLENTLANFEVHQVKGLIEKITSSWGRSLNCPVSTVAILSITLSINVAWKPLQRLSTWSRVAPNCIMGALLGMYCGHYRLHYSSLSTPFNYLNSTNSLKLMSSKY